MKSILRDAKNAAQILELTSDTLILLDKEGVCIDINTYGANLWFLNERLLLGKNLLRLLPRATYNEVYPTFRAVLQLRERQSRNFSMTIKGQTYHVKCIMYPYMEGVLCQYRDITERSQRKLELIKKNNELCEIQKAALIGNWEYDSDTRTFRYHGGQEAINMKDMENISLQDYRETIVPEDKETFDKWVEDNLHGDLENNITYRTRTDDHISYFRLKCYARERHKDGSTTLEGYVQNITDIQQSRNDINLLTHAINNCTEDIYAATEEGTLLFANRRFRERHNINKRCLANPTNIFDLPTYGRNKEGWKEFAQNVKKDMYDSTYIVNNPINGHPDVLAIEANSYWVTSDEGVGSVWTFGRDVSERLRSEQAIKRFYQILDKTIENLPAGIVVKDIGNDFKYLYCNRSSMLGISDENAIGKDDFDFHPAKEAQCKRDQDIEVATTGVPMHWVEERNMKDGTVKFIDKQKIRIDSNDFPSILLSIDWDITNMERMKRELIEAKEKAEMSDQLKSAFLANMSHEIRTPLNAIVGFSRVIAESEDAEERKEYYNIVESNNERLLKLINEILDLSKIEAGIVEFAIAPMRLHPLCREIAEALVMRCPEGVHLTFEPSDENIVMDSDKNRVFQVISNLIGNAYKFTTNGMVSYGYEKDGENIVFHVSDTGRGIPPEKVESVFERFVKADNFVQGTGLGLSICKTIVERLGGCISVSSEFGKGTTFTFTLPQHSHKKQAEATEAVPAEATDRAPKASAKTSEAQGAENEGTSGLASPKTILVAEDTDCNYILLQAILGKTFHLERAQDGMEAVTLYDELHPDLILMDMKMPNLGGLDATKIIRELSPNVPIIALTAFAYEKDKNLKSATDILWLALNENHVYDEQLRV